MKRRILNREFFARPTLLVARELLGKYLVRRHNGKTYTAMITEVEAYDGYRDKGSHAAKGETSRNAPMFGDAGVWYVYLVYGMHNMLNIVTREKGYPAALLIRGVEGVNGPGRLTKAFHIIRAQNGKNAVRASGLWIEDRGVLFSPGSITRSPRIGIDYAGELWAGKHWRFSVRTK